MEREQVELFDPAKKAVDALTPSEGGSEESGCLDALKSKEAGHNVMPSSGKAFDSEETVTTERKVVTTENTAVAENVVHVEKITKEMKNLPPITCTGEMASDERKEETTKKLEEEAILLFDSERGNEPNATADLFKCGRCGQRNTTFYQIPNADTDESMTTYVTCTNCNIRWKFCL